MVVDADRVLALAVAAECLEAIARRHRERVQSRRRVNQEQFDVAAALNVQGQAANELAPEHRRRRLVGEALDHGPY